MGGIPTSHGNNNRSNHVDSTNIVLCCVSKSLVDSGVALREGLNSNSLSPWEATSIHTSLCTDMPTAQIYTSTILLNFKSHTQQNCKIIKLNCSLTSVRTMTHATFSLQFLVLMHCVPILTT